MVHPRVFVSLGESSGGVIGSMWVTNDDETGLDQDV
jgi:hypothetical protein